jgi:acetyl esterase/lipase
LLGWSSAQALAAYIVESNIVYATGAINAHLGGGTKNLLLDIYRPVAGVDRGQALLLVHGGGFTTGNRAMPDMLDAAAFFAARGWVCFSIDYRLTTDDPPAPPWIEALHNPLLNAAHAAMVDSKRAIRWFRAHAQTYGCATNRVAGLGHSAGAYCVIQAAISDEADYANDSGTPTPDQWAGYRGQLNAAVEVSGGHGGTTSEFNSVDAPLMIWHGDADTVVPYAEAETIHQECAAHQIPHRFFTLVGKNHGEPTWTATYDGRGLKEHAQEFLDLFFNLRLGVAAQSGALRLSWPSISNAVYDVQSTPQFDSSFTNLASGLIATGDVVTVDFEPADSHRFLRVRIRSGQY